MVRKKSLARMKTSVVYSAEPNNIYYTPTGFMKIGNKIFVTVVLYSFSLFMSPSNKTATESPYAFYVLMWESELPNALVNVNGIRTKTTPDYELLIDFRFR